MLSLVLVHVDHGIAVCLERARVAADLMAVVLGLMILFQSCRVGLYQIDK